MKKKSLIQLCVIFVFSFLTAFLSHQYEFFESGAFVSYAKSLLHDGDFNLINQLASGPFVTKNFYFIDDHSPFISIFYIPFLWVLNLVGIRSEIISSEWLALTCVNTTFFFLIIRTIQREFGTISLYCYFCLLFGTSGYYFLFQDPSETSFIASFFYLHFIIAIKRLEANQPLNSFFLFLNMTIGLLIRKYMSLFVLPFVLILVLKKKIKELVIIASAVLFASFTYLTLDFIRHGVWDVTHSAKFISRLMGVHFFQRLLGSHGFFGQSPILLFSFVGLCFLIYRKQNMLVSLYSIGSFLLINFCVSVFPVGDNIPARNILVIIPGLVIGLEYLKIYRWFYWITIPVTTLGFLNHLVSMLYYGGRKDPRVWTLIEKVSDLHNNLHYFRDFLFQKYRLLSVDFFESLALLFLSSTMILVFLKLSEKKEFKVIITSMFLVITVFSMSLDFINGYRNGNFFCTTHSCHRLNQYDSMFFEIKTFYEISTDFKKSGINLNFSEEKFWNDYCKSVSEKALFTSKDCLSN